MTPGNAEARAAAASLLRFTLFVSRYENFSYRKCVKTGLIANKSISVLPVDDHTMFREGLRNLIKTEGDLELVGKAQSG
jgi:hypothetical protein